MPRRPSNLPEVTMQGRFRDRLIEEMERLGYTDAGLAHRASEYYPVTANTIWKIRNSEPARRIDLDEGMAISRALGHGDLESFLMLNRYSHELGRLQATVFHQVGSLGDVVDSALAGFEANLANIRLILEEAAHDKATLARLSRPNTRMTHAEAALDGQDMIDSLQRWQLQTEREKIVARLDAAEQALIEYHDWYRRLLAKIGRRPMPMPDMMDPELVALREQIDAAGSDDKGGA